ncbi:MAG: queuosine precursor transporter [Parachlamydia sp.]|nr:queuosine precursor transporter [Parachlamydia sp.]
MFNFYVSISVAFSVIVVVTNLLSSKMVALPLLGGFVIPFGILTYPLTFLLSDLVTEIFGSQKARTMVYTGMACSLLSLGIVQCALSLPPADADMQKSWQMVFGISKFVILGSLTAYIVGQILDIQLYTLIRRWTGERFLWLRCNGSTLLSQMIDTLIVNSIHLYWGLGLEYHTIVQIMLFSYCYKAFFSVANTPLFYLLVYLAKGERRVQPVPA